MLDTKSNVIDGKGIVCLNRNVKSPNALSVRKGLLFCLMKTALIKTDIWDDDVFYSLNIDTKIVYMLVLTSPERGVGRTFRMSDRMISARSGLSIDQIAICKKQLTKTGTVRFYDGWVNLTEKSSFIQPVKGKLTEITLARELADVPDDIANYFAKFSEVKRPVADRTVTGETPVHDNDTDNVHDKDHVHDDVPVRATYGNEEINEAFAAWQSIVGYPIQSNVRRNRQACSNLVKKHGTDGLEKLLRGVELTQHDQYAPRISDFVSLQAKLSDLMAWGKRKGEKSTVVVVA